jgi:hypothetical protein
MVFGAVMVLDIVATLGGAAIATLGGVADVNRLERYCTNVLLARLTKVRC